MPKATCIVGSARANGSTVYIIDTITKGLYESGIETVKRILICETDSLDDLLSKHQPELGELYLLGKNIAAL